MHQLEMKKLLDRIIEAKYQENSFFYDDPERPKPGTPASELDLRELDVFLAKKGLKAPNDYRSFLMTYNGIRHVLSPELSLLPAAAVLTAKANVIQELAEEFPSCADFVIGAGSTPEFVAFDINAVSAEGDFEVVWISGDMNEWRSKSFREFLERYLAILESRVFKERKDRENLKP